MDSLRASDTESISSLESQNTIVQLVRNESIPKQIQNLCFQNHNHMHEEEDTYTNSRWREEISLSVSSDPETESLDSAPEYRTTKMFQLNLQKA